MSLPDPTPPRKLTRLPLYIGFGLLAVLMIGWSAVWFWARSEAEARFDAAADSLRKAGYEFSWSDRRLGGYPFRLNITLSEPRIRDRSGWALEAPRLEGQAFLHAPTSWLIAAPDGLTFLRPRGGPVQVRGKLIRASLTRLTSRPPNVSFEAAGATFQPAAGASPFSLASADRVEIHLRRAPKEVGDEAGLWVSVEGGRGVLPGLLGRMADGKPVSLQWDSRLSKASELTGPTWAAMVRRWSDAGGRISVKRAGLTAGDAVIGASAGELRVGRDGRLLGVLDLSLRQAPKAIDAMRDSGVVGAEPAEAVQSVVAARQAGGDAARASLYFEAGRTTLGPIALWPAPKVYEPPR